jgi:lipopolysaccharide heptosyltransferase II
MMLLNAVGIPANEVEYKLPVSYHDRKTIDEIMKQHGISGVKSLIAINPVAKWETKLWPKERFARLADMMIDEYDAKIIFTGGSEDRLIIQDIMSVMKGWALNLAGHTNLKMLAALYEKTALVISTDTGPMHLAAAMGTPVVAIFGPTAPWRTGPYGSGHRVVRADSECSPCFKRQCETIDCMHQISVDQVFDAVSKIIDV